MNQRVGQSGVVLEGLEHRAMLSATGWSDPASLLREEIPAAVVMPIQMAPVKAARALPIQQVTGTWTGTCKITTNRTQAAGSFSITSQKGAGATGTFTGPFAAGTKLLSTAIVGSDHSFDVVLKGKNFYGGITATISANGKQIVGRWSCNGPAGWQTGTLVLNRA